MKSFRRIVQHIEQGRREHSSATASKRFTPRLSHLIDQANDPHLRQQVQRWLKTPGHLIHDLLKTQPHRRRKVSHATRLNHGRLLYAIAVVTLTSTIGYRFYNEPQLAVDTIAPQTLRAPQSASVVDVKTTEDNRTAARLGAVPVLMVDPTVNQRIYQNIQRLLDQGDSLRQQSGTFPFITTSNLSTSTQHYLRQAPEWEWRAAIAAVEGIRATPPSPQPPSPSTSRSTSSSSSQELAILELQNYRRTASPEDFSALKQIIERARSNYNKALLSLANTAPDEPRSFHTAELLELTDVEWLEAKVETRRILERMLAQGVPPGLPGTILKNAIEVNTSSKLPTAVKPLVVRMLVTVLEPNLAQDPIQTRIRAEQAAQAVEPVKVEIRRGEIIVETGETITQEDFVLLDHFGLSQRGVNWVGLIGFAALIGGSIALLLVAERRFHPELRQRDYILILLLTLTTPILMLAGISATSLPAVGLLIGSFYGSPLGVTAVGLLSCALALGMEISGRHLIASSAASLLGAWMAGRLRSREELAILGGTVGLTEGATYLLASLILSIGSSPVLYTILTASALQGLMGVAWSIVALGISPYLEQLFDLVTPIRLAELSNPNRPLLKRLASEAPGTFQHTLFVASLAEAAARSLGCNVELVRAGTLYHDIGKMHDAQSFIENQMGGPNKHDLINDPWKSADIIKKHVTEGLVMARRYRLPRAIQAFIPEHQGTMQIAYFYHQAQERARENPNLVVRDEDFRYDGPAPQSRETGIVMLADSCEAALRSLKDASYEEALAMINRILRARWQDNQLVDSGLTRSEMSQIAEIFVQVWQQVNHQRIAYPKLAPTPQPSKA